MEKATKFCLTDLGEKVQVDIEGKGSDLLDLLVTIMVKEPNIKELIKGALEAVEAKTAAAEEIKKGLKELMAEMKEMMDGI